ncbi:MAG: hypothetical protein ABI340_02730 [Nitrososphaera sp.]|jgi:hypothetical protein
MSETQNQIPVAGQNSNTQYTVKKLATKIYHQSLAWKACLNEGMHCEIYYDAENDKVTFSSAMTNNSWTNDPDKIGILHRLTPTDAKIYALELLSKIEILRKDHIELTSEEIEA